MICSTNTFVSFSNQTIEYHLGQEIERMSALYCWSCKLNCIYHHHTTTTVLQPFFWDHPAEPMPEESFFWTHGAREDNNLRQTHRQSRWVVLHPDWSAIHLHQLPIFTPDALPAATLPIYPGLGQDRNMLDCIPPQLGSKLHILYMQCTINTTRLSVSQSVTVSCCDFSCCNTEWSQQQCAWFSCWELSCCEGLAGWRWAWSKWASGHCTAVGAGRRVWLIGSAPQKITTASTAGFDWGRSSMLKIQELHSVI